MNIAQIGNFDPTHSSENEFRKAFSALGHDVWLVQEQDRRRWDELIARVHEFDVVFWTRTADLSKQIPHAVQRDMLIKARRVGVPTVAGHLDRWWGLREHGREDSVWSEPFFRCEHFFSTDGAHDLEWATAGVNHHWMPPGVSEFECVPGTPRDELRSSVCFIGSWRHYHGEWDHRTRLAQHLQDRGATMWPRPGEHSYRGEALRDLVASSEIIVGDSCLAPRADGGPMFAYSSDRLPELIGRGGFLLHPHVVGITDGTVFTNGEHLVTWTLGDFDELDHKIDYYLAHPDERERIAAAGAEHVRRSLTYTVRMKAILEAVTQEENVRRSAAQLKGTR